MHGSPNKLKARTFRATFRLPPAEKPQSPKHRQPVRVYRNPIILAHEWHQALDSAEYGSQADFARQHGVSRARVTQVLHLLNLTPDVLHTIASLGDPLPSRIITERRLRSVVHRPEDEQRQMIRRILVKSSQVAETPI